MISSPSPPKPPDPAETASAQTSTNVQTAIANSQLGNVDTYTPQGSIVYDQDPTKTQQITDQQGNLIDVPKYTSTTTFSPEQQALYEQNVASQTALGQFAGTQLGNLQGHYDQPFSGDFSDTEARLMELGSARLDPMLERQEDRERTRLSIQGLKEGDEAWNTAMERVSQNRNDAYNQLILGGNQQAYNQGLQTYREPASTIATLMYGSQPTAPQQSAYNGGNVAGVDYAGLINDNYNQQYNNWNTQQTNNAGTFGSLLGAAGTIGAALPWSDKRLKKNIKKVGNVGGHDIHEYRFKGQTKDDPKTLGVMAQDVEKTRPDAVATDPETGFKKVNYGALFGAS
jgi:hypothetical protein